MSLPARKLLLGIFTFILAVGGMLWWKQAHPGERLLRDSGRRDSASPSAKRKARPPRTNRTTASRTAANAEQDPPYAIRGRVLDQEGRPVLGARIMLTTLEGEIEGGTPQTEMRMNGVMSLVSFLETGQDGTFEAQAFDLESIRLEVLPATGRFGATTRSTAQFVPPRSDLELRVVR